MRKTRRKIEDSHEGLSRLRDDEGHIERMESLMTACGTAKKVLNWLYHFHADPDDALRRAECQTDCQGIDSQQGPHWGILKLWRPPVARTMIMSFSICRFLRNVMEALGPILISALLGYSNEKPIGLVAVSCGIP